MSLNPKWEENSKKDLVDAMYIADEAVRELRAENERLKQGWISVEDRLPYDKAEYHLVYNPTSIYSKVQPETYYSDGQWSIDKKFITHWMPVPALPEPPKDKEQ